MKITVYTVSYCPFSKQEKEYLKSLGLQFEEKNLEENPQYLDEMLKVSNNFAGTPVTVIQKDDGSTVVLKGFTKEEFDKVLGVQPAQPQQSQPATQPQTSAPQPQQKPPKEKSVPSSTPSTPTPQNQDQQVQQPTPQQSQPTTTQSTEEKPAEEDVKQKIESLLKEAQAVSSQSPSPTPTQPTQPTQQSDQPQKNISESQTTPQSATPQDEQNQVNDLLQKLSQGASGETQNPSSNEKPMPSLPDFDEGGSNN